MKPLAALVLALSALPACAEESLDDLWKTAVLWEVGDNVEKVAAARKEIIARGEAALTFLIPARLETADGLAIRALESTIPVIAKEAGDALRTQAVQGLMAALDSPNPNVRRNAANLLGHCGAAEAAPALAKLLGDKDARGGALAALGALKVAAAVPEIVAAIRTPGASERFRVAAVSTLGAIGGPEALAALVSLLSDPASPVRFAAQYALETLKATDVLLPLLDSPQRRVRLHAIEALGRIPAPEAKDALRKLAGDADRVVRGSVIEALTAMASKDEREWFEKRLEGEEDPFVVKKLEDALAALRRQ